MTAAATADQSQEPELDHCPVNPSRWGEPRSDGTRRVGFAGESHLGTGLPAELLAEDARLLDASAADGEPRMRWYRASAPAVVGGLAQSRQLGVLLDRHRCARAGVSVHARASGGGLVFWDDGMLCLSIAIPVRHPLASGDATDAYAWLGTSLLEGLTLLGVADCRMVPVAEARKRGFSSSLGDDVSRALAASCYAYVSPHEIVVVPGRGSCQGVAEAESVEGAKMVGLAQCRRKGGSLFQAGILLRNQARLADFMRVSGWTEREAVRTGLASATRGLFEVLGDDVDVTEAVRVLMRPLGERLWPMGRPARG